MAARDRIQAAATATRTDEAPKRSIIDVLQAPATREQIALALPPSLDVDRFLRLARTAVKLDPGLQACTAESFIAALHKAATYGLEPGTGQCYLQRYKASCTFVLGYRGIIDLARRSGLLVSIEARAVYENDQFDYEYGLNERLQHRPALEDHGELRCFYGVAKFKDGGHYWLVVPIMEILRHRDRSESWLAKARGQGTGGPWASDFEAMARKTVIRIMEPYLPLSPTAREAIQADGSFQDGVDAPAQFIDANAEPVDDTPDEDDEPQAEGFAEELDGEGEP